MPRIPYADETGSSPELDALYERCRRDWGSVPRFARLLAHQPAFVEGWLAFDRGVRLDRLKAGDEDFVRIEELVILKSSYINACGN